MAATTGVNIETQQGIREYLRNIIGKLNPYKNPITNFADVEVVTNSTVNWTEQEMRTPSADNTNVHGFSSAFALTDHKVRTKKYNYTQLMDQPVDVDKSELAMKIAGGIDEFAEQKQLRLLDLMNDQEKTISSANTKVAPAPENNTAGKMDGLQTLISTNAITCGAGAYPETYLKQETLDDLLGLIATKSGGGVDKFVGGTQACRAVAGFILQTNQYRDVGNGSTTVTNVVKRYEAFGGLLDILPSLMLTNVILVLESARIKLGYLRAPDFEAYPDGILDGKAGTWKMESTVECICEKACGKITGLGYTV